jgi:Fur family zinc uptake transcriptional regulator
MFNEFKSQAVDKCYANKRTITPQRLHILETVYEMHKPVSAYEIRDISANAGKKLNIATIYRVLDFWCELNIVHRLNTMNKFASCTNPKEKHVHIVNCCQKCETSTESCSNQMHLDIHNSMKSLGLQLAPNGHLEIPVLCSHCH